MLAIDTYKLTKNSNTFCPHTDHILTDHILTNSIPIYAHKYYPHTNTRPDTYKNLAQTNSAVSIGLNYPPLLSGSYLHYLQGLLPFSYPLPSLCVFIRPLNWGKAVLSAHTCRFGRTFWFSFERRPLFGQARFLLIFFSVGWCLSSSSSLALDSMTGQDSTGWISHLLCWIHWRRSMCSCKKNI